MRREAVISKDNKYLKHIKKILDSSSEGQELILSLDEVTTMSGFIKKKTIRNLQSVALIMGGHAPLSEFTFDKKGFEEWCKNNDIEYVFSHLNVSYSLSKRKSLMQNMDRKVYYNIVDWFNLHRDSIDKKLSSSNDPVEPSSEDILNPCLWKGCHWRWFLEKGKSLKLI